MGKAGNRQRKARAKNAAQKVLTAAAEAEKKFRSIDPQEQIEIERAYGPVDEVEPRNADNDTGSPVMELDPLGDQGDGQDAFGREVVKDAAHPPTGTDIVPWEAQEQDEVLTAVDVREAAKAGPPDDKWRVMICKDTKIEFPELYMEIYVAGQTRYEEAQFAELLVRSYCQRADSVDGADLVIFTGGSDVQPSMYGEEPHSETKFNRQRDASDDALYDYCWRRGIPMFGVCRGMQFLHVKNNGKLYQHVNGHYGKHRIVDIHTKETLEASSVHHQMCRANDKMLLIATANEATERWKNPRDCDRGSRAEIEALFYPETLCLGVQGHPEYKDCPRYSAWCMKLIEHYILINEDLDWVDNHRRLKPDLLLMREELKGL